MPLVLQPTSCLDSMPSLCTLHALTRLHQHCSFACAALTALVPLGLQIQLKPCPLALALLRLLLMNGGPMGACRSPNLAANDLRVAMSIMIMRRASWLKSLFSPDRLAIRDVMGRVQPQRIPATCTSSLGAKPSRTFHMVREGIRWVCPLSLNSPHLCLIIP